MNRLLLVEASPHGADSLGTRLAHEMVAHARNRYPHLDVVSRRIGAEPLPALARDYAEALVSMRPNDDPALACSERLIGELERSDGLLISTPMHNFTVPAALKLWIDYVLRIGRTFTATPAGKVGLLADRPTLVLVRSGGICTGEAARQPDFLTPYLTSALAVIGIESIEFVYLEGIAPEAAAIDAVRRQAIRSTVLN